MVIPAGYPKLWGGDFEAALQTHSFEDIQKAIAVSQLPKNKQYYVRAKSIVENLDSLLERAENVSLETLLSATKKSPPQGGYKGVAAERPAFPIEEDLE